MPHEPTQHVPEAALIEYVAGTLDIAERHSIEAHLMACEACRQTRDAWQQIASATRADSLPQPLPPLNWRLIKGDDPMIIERPMTATPRQPVASRKFNFAFPMTFAALAIAAVALFTLMGGPSGDEGNFGMVGQNQQNDDETVAEATLTPLPPLMTPTPTAAHDVVFPTATPMVLELMPTIASPDGIPLMTPTLGAHDPYNMFRQPEYMVIIVVAARDIENGSVIKPEDLTVYAIDERFVPENLRLTPEDFIFRITRFNLACGQILTANMVAESARDLALETTDFTPSENCNVKKSYTPSYSAFPYNTVLYYQTEGGNPAVYYTRELPAGHVVTTDDVVVRDAPVAALIPAGAASSLDDVIGQTLNVPVAEGQAAIVE